ncbi:hypothetical protein ACLOJK_014820 [Asimina triloba]
MICVRESNNFTSLRYPFTSWIRLVVLSGTATRLLRDAFMSALLKEARALSVDDDPYFIDADNDPCSRKGLGGSAPTPIISSLRAVSSFFTSIEGQRVFKSASLWKLPSSLLMRLWGGIVEFIRWRRTARASIKALPFFSLSLSVGVRMSGKKLITPEDLTVIREGYNIPSSIVLLVIATHETPRDNHPVYVCLSEYMLGARVQIPFDFEVAEVLWAFNVPLACVISHSRKCDGTKKASLILPNACMDGRRDFSLLGWRLRGIFGASPSNGRSLCLLPNGGLSCTSEAPPFADTRRGKSSFAGEGEQRAPKRVHPSEEEVVAQLKKELEASRAKVAQLQSMLRGDVAHPSAMVEYLRSDAYRRRMEFKQAHHSRSEYIKALLDVVVLYPELDLSSLYRSP